MDGRCALEFVGGDVRSSERTRGILYRYISSSRTWKADGRMPSMSFSSKAESNLAI